METHVKILQMLRDGYEEIEIIRSLKLESRNVVVGAKWRHWDAFLEGKYEVVPDKVRRRGSKGSDFSENYTSRSGAGEGTVIKKVRTGVDIFKPDLTTGIPIGEQYDNWKENR